MYSPNEIPIDELLGKMVVQLSCKEFCALARYATASVVPSVPVQPIQAVGIHALAEALGCSVSYLYALKAKGVLDDAIISHLGKKVVFDIDKARTLAISYQEVSKTSK